MKVILNTRTNTVSQRLWLATVCIAAFTLVVIYLEELRLYGCVSSNHIIDAQMTHVISRPQVLKRKNVSLTAATAAEEEEDPTAPKERTVSYHIVFSTDCSPYQQWQSYVFFYYILRSGQEGHVTRIVSGCQKWVVKVIKEMFDEEIAVMAPGRFHLHLTPDYTRIKPGMTYIYMNKPYGLQHWMEETLGYPNAHEQHDDTIIILMDPDQILFRPLTNDFTHSSVVWRFNPKNKLKVEHGSPFAQIYGYGHYWKTLVDIEHVFQGPSPVSNMTDDEAKKDYIAIGPPYIATAKDMYTIVKTWTEILPRVLDNYPKLLAEMFSYNLAAAHHGLVHTTAISFMVSNAFVADEGWSMIDQIPAKDVCHNFPLTYYPHIFHFCQGYRIGKWFIGKTHLRTDFISCESPLLVMPPKDLAIQGNTTDIDLGGANATEITPEDIKRQAFMVCTSIRLLNEAAIYYKDHHCTKEDVNYDYSMTVAENKPKQ